MKGSPSHGHEIRSNRAHGAGKFDQSSLQFYTGALDFTVKWSWSADGDFSDASKPDFVCLECGEAVLFLSEFSGGSASSLFVELPFVEDIDKLAESLNGLGVIQEPPDTMPWGSREFELRDPDGHTLRFSCPADRTRDTRNQAS